MLKVDKIEEPDFFKEYKRTYNPKNWTDFTSLIKRDLKNYMLENEQKINNKKYCPYCEREIIIDKSQIEHIQPKDKFPSLFAEYKNFITGCINNKTCGQSKNNQWNEKLFINPVVEDPNDYLTYEISGEIVPIEKTGIKYDKAMETIRILNLNQDKLLSSRKKFILELIFSMKFLQKEEIKDFIDIFDEFPTLRTFLKENMEILYNFSEKNFKKNK